VRADEEPDDLEQDHRRAGDGDPGDHDAEDGWIVVTQDIRLTYSGQGSAQSRGIGYAPPTGEARPFRRPGPATLPISARDTYSRRSAARDNLVEELHALASAARLRERTACQKAMALGLAGVVERNCCG
jgi:hypothetical protein